MTHVWSQEAPVPSISPRSGRMHHDILIVLGGGGGGGGGLAIHVGVAPCVTAWPC